MKLTRGCRLGRHPLVARQVSDAAAATPCLLIFAFVGRRESMVPSTSFTVTANGCSSNHSIWLNLITLIAVGLSVWLFLCRSFSWAERQSGPPPEHWLARPA